MHILIHTYIHTYIHKRIQMHKYIHTYYINPMQNKSSKLKLTQTTLLIFVLLYTVYLTDACVLPLMDNNLAQIF